MKIYFNYIINLKEIKYLVKKKHVTVWKYIHIIINHTHKRGVTCHVKFMFWTPI